MKTIKAFKNWTEFTNLTSKKSLFVQLINQYHCPVSRKSLKEVADRMKKNSNPFTGTVTEVGPYAVQILIH